MVLAALTLLTTVVPATAQPPVEPLEVQLDDTGVSIKFVNPVDPTELWIQVDPDNPVDRWDRPLRFVNTTGDRTFIVSIPFVYSAVELASAYAVADEERGQQVVHEIVCEAIRRNGGGSCSDLEMKAIDTREGLRVLYEAVSLAKSTSLAETCGRQLKGADCIAETLFWRAACQRGNQPELLRFARQIEESSDSLAAAVKGEASKLVEELLGERIAPTTCTFDTLVDLQKRVDQELMVVPDLGPLIDPIAADAKNTGLKARFGAERVRVAKEALQAAIREKMQRVDVTSVLDRLDERWDDLREKEQRTRLAGDKRIMQCQLRELEAAAKLLTSYSLDFNVPYRGIPATLLSAQRCEDAPPISAAAAMQEVRATMAERTAEQSVEITDCKADASVTTCVATATIPPYQYATYSLSILEHHPTPRIAFTVAFFGETEVPANAAGYVIRADAKEADKKPKSAFALSFGGDVSSSMDPAEDISGQLRHSGSSGALSFLYTGAVEASATLRFKQGDFGGPADSNKIEASQYQGKVFGHRIDPLFNQAVSLQYGKLQFAKPSSGIAVNVFGEGLQLALGSGSIAYVVLRESDDLEEVANTQNDDSSLWIFQLRNLPLAPRTFRTFEVVALYGRDKRDEEKTPVIDPQNTFLPIPFSYWSAGFEFRWGSERVPALGASIAGYYSDLDVGSGSANLDSDPQRPRRRDGYGWTALARVSRTPVVPPPLNKLEKSKGVRQAYGASLLVGYGTGDNDETADEDEGYLGENAGFSNDVLFLSRVSRAFPTEIGSGLANKWYGGLQFTDAQAGWLANIPRLLNVSEEDIVSTSSGLSLHTYYFVREVRDRRWGGVEADGELNVEAPKNIRWSLGAAYYLRSAALKAVGLDNDLWSFTAKLSIALSHP